MGEDGFGAVYRLRADDEDAARARARVVALEQSVELPEGCFPEAIERDVVPRLESLRRDGETWLARLVFPPGLTAGEPTQFLNLLFGNVSMMRGVRVESVDPWPDLGDALPGPGIGVAGWRRLCGVEEERPLLCAALKPLGRSARELADLCARFAHGGADLVKDDHGLTDPGSAPFDERLVRCLAAVQGTRTVYVPNVAAAPDETLRRAERAVAAGCRAVMTAPGLHGVDTLAALARRRDLALLAHPTLSGGLFGDDHGIAPSVWLGGLLRRAGADGVIYPDAAGRFPWSRETCDAVRDALRSDVAGLRPSMPAPGGGLRVERIPERLARDGADMIYLVGGSLHASDDVTGATRRLMDALRAAG